MWRSSIEVNSFEKLEKQRLKVGYCRFCRWAVVRGVMLCQDLISLVGD